MNGRTGDAGNARRERSVPAFDVEELRPARTGHCVVVPVIDEGDRIRSLLERMAAAGVPKLADVIIADGGSTDGSLGAELLSRTGVSAKLTKTGEGRLGGQLRCGYAFALERGYRGVVTIDGNDKDDPASIPAFLAELDAGTDFVQASRFVEGGVGINTPKARDLAIRWVHAPVLSAASGFRWTDTTQGYRGYSARLLADERVGVFRPVFDSYELLAYLSYRAPKLGFACKEIPTVRVYPPGKPPTKIAGLRGNLDLLRILARTVAGRYDP